MCIFCKIINEELPCYKVYEDDYVLAFLDINPVTYGHTLVLPKQHVEKIEDATAEVMMHIGAVLPKLTKKIKETCNAKGFHYLSNSEKISGQIVDHLHFHIIPRYSDEDHFSIQHSVQNFDLQEVLSTILQG